MRLHLSDDERYPHLYFETEEEVAADETSDGDEEFVEIPDELAQRLRESWRAYLVAEKAVRAIWESADNP